MPDYLTTVTAQDTIKGVSKSLVLKLCRALGLPEGEPLPYKSEGNVEFKSTNTSCYSIEWHEATGTLYVFAENWATTGEVPDEFWQILARLLTKSKMDYLTFTYAHHCSKATPGSFGGGEFRLYRDGTLTYAVAKYPDHTFKDDGRIIQDTTD